MGEIFGQDKDGSSTNVYGEQYKMPGGLDIIPAKFVESASGLIVPEYMISEQCEQRLNISGYVGQEMYDGLAEALSVIDGDPNVTHLDIKLTTYGGSVDYGFAMYDLVDVYSRANCVPVMMTAYGPVMSMGVLILQAATWRRMSKNSVMMLHDFSMSSCTFLSKEDLKGEVGDIDAEQRLYMDLIAKRARTGGVKGTTIATVRSLCSKNGGSYLKAKDAKKYGFVDEII